MEEEVEVEVASVGRDFDSTSKFLPNALPLFSSPRVHHQRLTDRLFRSHGVQCDTAGRGNRGARGGRAARRRARKRHAPFCVMRRSVRSGAIDRPVPLFCFFLFSCLPKKASRVFAARSLAVRSFLSSSHVRQGAPAQGTSELRLVKREREREKERGTSERSIENSLSHGAPKPIAPIDLSTPTSSFSKKKKKNRNTRSTPAQPRPAASTTPQQQQQQQEPAVATPATTASSWPSRTSPT